MLSLVEIILGWMILALLVFIWIVGTIIGMYFAELVVSYIAGAEW
jgi:hypothetical protein